MSKRFTLDQMIKEARLEIEFRERVYTRQVQRGAMDRDRAEERIDLMKNILKTLEWCKRTYRPENKKQAQAEMELGITSQSANRTAGIPD